MARTIAFVPSAPAKGTPLVPIESVPQEIRDEVEEAYAALQANPNGRFHAEFDDKVALAQYVTYVTAYCKQRPAGEIRFRKSPTKGLPDSQMDFTIKSLKADAADTAAPATDAAPEATAVPAKKAARKAA